MVVRFFCSWFVAKRKWQGFPIKDRLEVDYTHSCRHEAVSICGSPSHTVWTFACAVRLPNLFAMPVVSPQEGGPSGPGQTGRGCNGQHVYWITSYGATYPRSVTEPWPQKAGRVLQRKFWQEQTWQHSHMYVYKYIWPVWWYPHEGRVVMLFKKPQVPKTHA